MLNVKIIYEIRVYCLPLSAVLGPAYPGINNPFTWRMFFKDARSVFSLCIAHAHTPRLAARFGDSPAKANGHPYSITFMADLQAQMHQYVFLISCAHLIINNDKENLNGSD